MKCYKCGARMRRRVIEPFGAKQPVTLYECRSALCEDDEDDEPRYRGRRSGHLR
jgi:hypothetical protein